MMKFPFLPALCSLLLVGCTLSIPEPAEPAPSTKAEYDVVLNEGREVRHYNGNDQLMWIDRYELANDLQLKKYHYSALDSLLWYEYRRFEQYAGQWLMTRNKHFVGQKEDEGTLAWSQSWGYDAQGHTVVQVDFDELGAVTGYQHTWGKAPVDTYRTLQSTSLSGAGAPKGYERIAYLSDSDNRVAKRARLSGDRSVTWAQSLNYVGDNRTSVVEFDADAWSRTTTSFVPDTSTRYRSVWYESSATGPSTPGFAADQSGAPTITTSTATTAATFDPDPENDFDPAGAIVDFSAVQLVDFPTLNTPSSWTPEAWEYYLPGPYGEVTLRLDADGLPKSLTKAASGEFQAIDLEFAWDQAGRLVQRLAKYAGKTVLSVDLHRDDQDRVDRIDTSGSMMKVPLTYSLVYDSSTTQRPSTITVSNKTVAPNKTVELLTLTLTYDANPGAGKFGLEALSFDDHIQSIRVGVGGPNGTEGVLDAVGLKFLSPVTVDGVTTKEVTVYDVLNKNENNWATKGRLLWKIDTDGNQTSFAWQTWNGSSYQDAWDYGLSWGAWADLATGAVDIVADSGEGTSETVEAIEAKLAGAMRLVDSFDFERLFQLVDSVRDLPAAQQDQFERTAGSLLDQIKAAAGK